MTSKEKQEYAFLLYTKHDALTQEEIAEKVGVHKNTISRWKDKGAWDQVRETLLTTRHEQLRRLYMQLKELNDHIMGKEEGQRFANKSEADSLTQITRSIKNLEQDMSVGTVIDVFIPFLEFVSKMDGELAKRIVEMQDSYIKNMMR
jgi:DNA-binding XRE family transcriptional regulator